MLLHTNIINKTKQTKTAGTGLLTLHKFPSNFPIRFRHGGTHPLNNKTYKKWNKCVSQIVQKLHNPTIVED